MEVFAVAIIYVGGIWASVYLIMNEHPWFGLFVLIVTASFRYSSRRTPDAPDLGESSVSVSLSKPAPKRVI